ncbi:MAG: family 78 glycoside hydrolase catalytic domain [Phycisphaeraceae bacterium]
MLRSDAKYVWLPTAENASPRVDWLIFHFEVQLADDPVDSRLCLFASTRYRLRVNDRILGHGPARYVPGHEEFDTYDLTPHLARGGNRIVVEACFIDANNFQSMPGDRGRFIAWGSVNCSNGATRDLSTPGNWRAYRATAWRGDVPGFSFAIGPIEVVDQSPLEAALAGNADWQNPTVIGTSAPSLLPRSVAMPTNYLRRPALLHAGPIVQDEHRIGLVSILHDNVKEHHRPWKEHSYRYAAFIHSPCAQTIGLGLHWGPHFLNGAEIAAEDDPVRGNRLNGRVNLREGWNLLCGEPVQSQGAASLLIGIPNTAGLVVRSRPDRNDPDMLRYLPPSRRARSDQWAQRPPATVNDLALDDPRWKTIAPDAVPPCPARMLSWDEPNQNLRVMAPSLPLIIPGGATWSMIFDFGGEYLGHIGIEIEAVAGTMVDLGYDERLRADGCLKLFSNNSQIESADRFVSRDGRQTLHTFHPRGGRYLQVTVRSASQLPSELTAVFLRDARCLSPIDSRFECDDPVFNWTWEHGIETLQAGMEDSFCDTPWRERGTYLGDSYVHSLAHLCVSRDHRPVQRALRLFAQAQHEDGLLPPVVPSWHRRPHCDFVLIYPLWLRDYWARTGDLALVKECLSTVEALINSPAWTVSTHSLLWDARESHNLFIDWGADRRARLYDENAVLNALRFRALQCTAELAAACGQTQASARWSREATSVCQAFRERLWLADVGRFAPGSQHGNAITHEMIHANILALAFGLAAPSDEERMIQHVIDRLAGNVEKAARGIVADDFAELYFLKFALDAMVRIGRFDVAENIIRSHMGFMMDRHAWTLWECIHRGAMDKGSLCHAWAAAPVEYLARHVLGVREASPGQPTPLQIRPQVSSVGHARGSVASSDGCTQVDWQRDDQEAIRVNTPLHRNHTQPMETTTTTANIALVRASDHS